MKASLLTARLVATSFSGSLQAQVCDHNKPCTTSRPASRPIPQSQQPPRVPTPLPQTQHAPSQTRETPNSVGNLEPDWDLPNDPASRTKAPPTRAESTPSPAPSATPTQRPAAPQAPTGLSERLMQAGAARQAVITTITRLSAKRDELVRWDRDDQAKFQRIFGTTDEALRQRVLDRLDVEIANSQKLVAQITDNMAMELYLQSKRKK